VNKKDKHILSIEESGNLRSLYLFNSGSKLSNDLIFSRP